jgi:hypothetical protein
MCESAANDGIFGAIIARCKKCGCTGRWTSAGTQLWQRRTTYSQPRRSMKLPS